VLEDAYTCLLENCTVMVRNLTFISLVNFDRVSWPSLLQVYQLFYLFDVDGDGIIGRDDFMMCLRRNPLLIAIFAAHVG